MDEEKNARIIVGASEVAGDRRHLYLLFERSNGIRIVVRGGPDTRPEGNDLANLAESTLLGSEKFGHLVVDAAPYVPPYEAALKRQQDGTFVPVPFEQADPNDPSLTRNAQGDLIRQTIVAPDWQGPGEKHERTVAWTGTDQELATKLEAAVQAGRQINDAKLEYSPLYNNSNGVVGNLMKAVGVKPVLPKDTEGEPVKAPDFGEDLYQDVGLASNRSGYRFNGTQWYDEDDRKIAPPKSGQPVVPQDPGEPKRGSSDGFKLSAADQQPEDPLFGQILEGVRRIDASLGRTPDAASERMTWGLYALAKEQRMERVDDIALGRAGTRAAAGEYVFLIQGDPAGSIYRREQMRTADAVEATVEQSQARVQAAEHAHATALKMEPEEPVRQQQFGPVRA